MNRQYIQLAGLDGSNPLAFLAALGLLRSAARIRPCSKLCWSTGSFYAVLHGWEPEERDALADAAVSAITTACSILSETNYPSVIPSVRVKPCRDFCRAAIVSGDPMHLGLASSLSCEGARYLWEPNARQKKQGVQPEERARGSRLCNADNPGGKRLIGMFRQFPRILATTIAGESRNLKSFVTAVFDSWEYHSSGDYAGAVKFPAFRWDPAENRPAAHEAANPDGDNLPSIPGANALAVLGLTFFVTAPTPEAITACVDREDRRDRFTWPLWEMPLGCDAISSLLVNSSLWIDPLRRTKIGVASVFRCMRQTTDNGSHFFLDSFAI